MAGQLQGSTADIYDPLTGQMKTLAEMQQLIAEREQAGRQNPSGMRQATRGPGGIGTQGLPSIGFSGPPQRQIGPQLAEPEPIELGEMLPEAAGLGMMLAELAVPESRLLPMLTMLAPGAAEFARQKMSGEDTDFGTIADTTAVNALPMMARVAKWPSKLSDWMGTRTRAITRGGDKVKKGTPVMSARFNTAAEIPSPGGNVAVQTDQLLRMGDMAKKLKLGINKESFDKLDQYGTSLLNQIVSQLPRNAVVNAGDDILAVAKKLLPKTPENKLLLQQFDDTTQIYSLLKQSERAGHISGANVARGVAGASAGGVAQMAGGAAGLSFPAASALGATIGIPAAMLNMGAKQSLGAANLFDTLATKVVPGVEGSIRATMTAHSGTGKPRRRKKPGEKDQ